VLEQVAVGGMGIVLKARDPELNRLVALKILPPTMAANHLARARFIREARAAAAVVHEHVVPIHAVDEFAGLPYLVMQFIRGRPLSERIRVTGPLRLEEILRIGAQSAAALAAAHAQGLIHRDVKPGNILLENSVERVKITDFGLARAADGSSLTRDGYIVGTPEYMSPEQANGQPVDARADLFSLGCVLYEMATGVSPFRAEQPVAALHRVCKVDPPSAHSLNTRIPEWLGRFIQKLMAKDAASRPQTATDVAEELGRRLAESQHASDSNRFGDNPPRAGGMRHRFSPASLAGLITSVVLGLVFVIFIVKRPGSQPRQDETGVRPRGETNAAARSESQSALLFFVSASGDQPEKGFATPADAVEAAPAGATIECRFNGQQTIQTPRRIEKALILRAAPGFEPALTSTSGGAPALLMTHAPLVLEGLTLATRSPTAARQPG
jgi:serine/threonine-protein kinase